MWGQAEPREEGREGGVATYPSLPVHVLRADGDGGGSWVVKLMHFAVSFSGRYKDTTNAYE